MQEYNSIKVAIKDIFDNNTEIIEKKVVSGGDINSTYILSLSNNEKLFIKTNSITLKNMFILEFHELETIKSLNTINVPTPLAVGIDKNENISFLIMEKIKSGIKDSKFFEDLGHNLALMHKTDCSSILNNENKYGFYEDNYIGKKEQKNNPSKSFIEFFRDYRLLDHYEMTKNYFDVNLKDKFFYLLDHLDKYLIEPSFPSLIHGDLWGGNIMSSKNNGAYIIDPAAHISFYETDLAMSELFGGFSDEFYLAYNEINKIDSEYRTRRDIYNLYHLINHLDHFGAGYYSAVKEIIEYYV